MKPDCYAQRLLNPFRGVMNIIEYQGAEAVTIDGIHWDIYVRDTELVEDLENPNRIQTSDIRYGSWSEQEGLKRGAIFPSQDFRILEQRGTVVYNYLLKHYRDIPFALKDHFELWLLDRSDQPLALLNSTMRENSMELDCHIDWRAGLECRKTFLSSALQALTTHSQQNLTAGELLTDYVNQLSGEIPRAQWFQRNEEGYGQGLAGINIESGLEERLLDTAAFPAWFINHASHSSAHTQLIHDFIAWQAPCLLLLQTLDAETRGHFETLATKRALCVEKHYRLYPDIIDQDALNAARVEATLRKNDPDYKKEEEVMSTYYIELNISRTN